MSSVTFSGSGALTQAIVNAGLGSATIVIIEGYTSIGYSAFTYKGQITSVTIPNSVTSIGSYAFYNCSGLTSITIPNSVTSIGLNAFRGCSGLKLVTFEPTSKVTSIGDGAFYQCFVLTSITIPNSVTTIGNGAFYDCSILTSITIPNSVTSIGIFAFNGCSILTSITIPNSVTSIGNDAFASSGLTTVTISAATAAVLGITVPATNITFYGKPGVNTVCLVTFSGSGELTQTIVNAGLGSATIVIIEGYSSIGSYAFQNKTQITSVTIPNSVTSIEFESFQSCSGLTSVTIPDSVTSIGEDVFYLSGLTTVTISVENTLGIAVPATSINFFGKSGVNTVLPPVTFSGSGELTQSIVNAGLGAAKIVIIEGYSRIGSYAFDGKSQITSILIPNSVTSIGLDAFITCSNLTSITFEPTSQVASIDIGAFANCSSLTSILIPNTVTIISGYTFYGCSNLSSITIPNSVTTIWNSAFESCSKLSSVTFEPTSQVASIGPGAFYQCSILTSITIPNSVTSIDNNAFVNSGLTTVTMSAASTLGIQVPATNINFFGKSGVNTVLPPPTITNFSITTKTFNDSPFQITAPISNSSGSFSYTSSNTSVATISGSTVTVVGGGTTTITATQNPTTNYFSGSITTTFGVVKAIPTITNFSIPASTYGVSPFTITAPSSNSSGSFSYTSSNILVATISGSTITVVGVGTTTITAMQSSTTNYFSDFKNTTFVVSKATPTIANFSIPAVTFNDSPFTITAPSSNSSGSFSYTSSNTSVATIVGSTVTVVGGGTTTITATQFSTPNYTSGIITTTFYVSKATPTIANFSIPAVTFNDSPFTITAPSSTSSGSFSYTSSNTSVATIVGSTVTVVGGGTTTITATQFSTPNYTSGIIITTTFQVNPYINNVYTSSNNYKNIYISGLHFVEGTNVLFTGSSVPVPSLYTVVVMNSTLLKVTMISPYEIDTVTVTDINSNSSNTFILTPDLISNICFIAGTPVTTDQGNIPIEKINPAIHTIRNKKIVAITKTVTQDKYLVCFEKDALGKNIPSQKTTISKNHNLFYNGKMRMAKEFLKDFSNVENVVVKVKYTKEILYNVLLEEHDKMMVNNLICETLDPENGVAKVYMALQTLNSEDQKSLIRKINAHVINNKVFNSKRLIK